MKRSACLLLLCVALFATGCGPRLVGLRKSLAPPQDLQANKVNHNPRERQKAIDYFKERALRYGNMRTLYFRGRRLQAVGRSKAIIQDEKIVHWEELIGITNKAYKKKILDKRRPLQIVWGTTALVVGVGAAVGSVFLFMGATEKNAPLGASRTNVVLGTTLSAVGFGVLLVAPALYNSHYGILPRKAEIRKGVRAYNRQLSRNLGLRRRRGILGKFNIKKNNKLEL